MTPEQRGKRVCGPSEHTFGVVERVVPGTFLLRTTDGAEHWLSRDCVYLVEVDRVILICEREGVSRYVVESSPGAPAS